MSQEISKRIITCDSIIKVNAEQAINKLVKESQKYDPDSTLYYNEIKLNSRLILYTPGKFGQGDYLLRVDGHAPTHVDICKVIINDLEKFQEQGGKFIERYSYWIRMLEDVYKNGTLNIDDNTNEKDAMRKQVLFWVTLQEDINKANNLGRLIPFCRYAEAGATASNGSKYSYDQLVQRVNSTDPLMLERWELPVVPSYYRWCAW